MKKVIIRTREDELKNDMWLFGINCAKSFIDDLNKEAYGSDWKDCGYSNNYFSACANLNENGTISVCVFNKVKA